jgi:hypothetical protein
VSTSPSPDAEATTSPTTPDDAVRRHLSEDWAATIVGLALLGLILLGLIPDWLVP